MKQENLSDTVRLHSPAPHVAVITIDRPEARNAVSASVAEGIDRALTLTEADTDTWVVVLTGAGGKAFCAGADLKEVAAGRAKTLGTERGGFAGARQSFVRATTMENGGCSRLVLRTQDATRRPVPSTASTGELPPTYRG